MLDKIKTYTRSSPMVSKYKIVCHRLVPECKLGSESRFYKNQVGKTVSQKMTSEYLVEWNNSKPSWEPRFHFSSHELEKYYKKVSIPLKNEELIKMSEDSSINEFIDESEQERKEIQSASVEEYSPSNPNDEAYELESEQSLPGKIDRVISQIKVARDFRAELFERKPNINLDNIYKLPQEIIKIDEEDIELEFEVEITLNEEKFNETIENREKKKIIKYLEKENEENLTEEKRNEKEQKNFFEIIEEKNKILPEKNETTLEIENALCFEKLKKRNELCWFEDKKEGVINHFLNKFDSEKRLSTKEKIDEKADGKERENEMEKNEFFLEKEHQNELYNERKNREELKNNTPEFGEKFIESLNDEEINFSLFEEEKKFEKKKNFNLNEFEINEMIRKKDEACIEKITAQIAFIEKENEKSLFISKDEDLPSLFSIFNSSDSEEEKKQEQVERHIFPLHEQEIIEETYFEKLRPEFHNSKLLSNSSEIIDKIKENKAQKEEKRPVTRLYKNKQKRIKYNELTIIDVDEEDEISFEEIETESRKNIKEKYVFNHEEKNIDDVELIIINEKEVMNKDNEEELINLKEKEQEIVYSEEIIRTEKNLELCVINEKNEIQNLNIIEELPEFSALNKELSICEENKKNVILCINEELELFDQESLSEDSNLFSPDDAFIEQQLLELYKSSPKFENQEFPLFDLNKYSSICKDILLRIENPTEELLFWNIFMIIKIEAKWYSVLYKHELIEQPRLIAKNDRFKFVESKLFYSLQKKCKNKKNDK